MFVFAGAKFVSSDFHARFSATGRRYRYVVIDMGLRPAIIIVSLLS